MPDTHLDGRSADPASIASDVDGLPGALLTQHVEAIERLVQEKADIADAIKERYASLKADGFHIEVIKAIIAERKKRPEDVSTPLGPASVVDCKGLPRLSAPGTRAVF